MKLADGLLEKNYNTTRTAARDEQAKLAGTKTFDNMAEAFIQSSDRAGFKKSASDLDNEFLKGHDQYPAYITTVYNMLTNWKKTCPHREVPITYGVSFTLDTSAGNIDILDEIKEDERRVISRKKDVMVVEHLVSVITNGKVGAKDKTPSRNGRVD